MQSQEIAIIPQGADRPIGPSGAGFVTTSRFAKWELPSDMDLESAEAQLLKLQMRNAEYEANLRRTLKHLRSVKARTVKMNDIIAQLSADNKKLREALKSSQTKAPIQDSAGLHISF